MTRRSTTLPAFVFALQYGLLASLFAPAAMTSPQGSSTPVGPQSPRSPQVRSNSAYVVDPAGLGDFVSLSDAVLEVPSGALLLLAPGDHTGATIRSKSLRLESLGPGIAQLLEPLLIEQIGPKKEVSLGGLTFLNGFTVENCAGEVSLTACSAYLDGVFALYPPGLWGGDASDCGVAVSRHRIIASDAVTLVDCRLEGRRGYTATATSGCDGTPGEHAIMVEDSRVAIYGGALIGGRGGDGRWCHGVWTGSGGDAIWASGADTRVFHRDVMREGGEGGIDLNNGQFDGCDGALERLYLGAVADEGSAGAITFTIDSVVHPGPLASYTLTAPPGSEMFIALAATRSWREFVPSAGLLHLDPTYQSVFLGIMPATGSYTRTFPNPALTWAGGYGSVELQAYVRFAGQVRYSEPRTVQATPVGQ